MQDMENKTLFTSTEAARKLGISPSTLRRWQAVGIAHALMLPTGHRRFTLEEIERLMPKAQDTEPKEA